MTSVFALVHPTGLLALELKRSLEQRRELWSELRLLSSVEDEVGTLTEVAGAAAMVQRLDAESLEGVDVAFFCGPIEHNRALLERLGPETTALVLSPDATPEDGEPIVAGVNLEHARRELPLLSPHPGAVALAHLLHALRDFAPRRATATLLEPASAISAEAVDEVLEQTRAILAFRGDVPHAVHGAQLAFNLLPTGSARPITRLVRRVLDTRLPLAVQMLRAGVFHGYGVSLHVELAADPGLEALRGAYREHPLIELFEQPETVGPIDAAAGETLLLGTIHEADDGGYWIWGVMDNLTFGGATNVIHILEAIHEGVIH